MVGKWVPLPRPGSKQLLNVLMDFSWSMSSKVERSETFIYMYILTFPFIHLPSFCFCSKLFFLFWWLSVYLLKLSGIWDLLNKPYSWGSLVILFLYAHTKPFVADVSHRGKPSQDVQPGPQTSWSAGNAKLVIKL